MSSTQFREKSYEYEAKTGKILSSKRKSSTKSRRNCSVPEGSSSQHVGVVPKVEFSAESINPEEVDAWWTAMGEVKPPTPVRPSRVRAWSQRSDRAAPKLGRYRPSRVRARSLRSNRAWLELSRYVATELCSCSVATRRPSRVRARSLRSDQAWLELGCYIATELGLSVVSGLLALLKVERDKIGAAPYDGCQRTLILPFLSLREEYVFEKMSVCMTVWSSKKVHLSRKDVFTQRAKDVVVRGLDHGVIDEGQRALVEIDRPSLPELSPLRWLKVIENDSML
ncbi:hypothetical protein DY000_02007838 [Brassica cretica]|uniref:Uncharacterized protein n=1 Tax=Brassica cretica TaxID=69181 RepID=A0ABQ7CCR6_BRACR|nr:hypothetical protein DY000_02007838 [Brassica cretica]